MTGTVQKFNARSGFGFIQKGFTVYYFHGSSLGDEFKVKNRKMCRRGTKVTFDEMRDGPCLSAVNIRKEK